MSTPQTISLGAARVSLLNLGELQAGLAGWLGVPPAAWPAEQAALLAGPIAVPVQALLIELPGAAVLVDACDPRRLAEIEAVPPGYAPPPDLFAQLEALGVAPERVGHVVITHLHADHYIGLARERGGRFEPRFPWARHHVGRADWQAAQAEIAAPADLGDHVLAALEHGGLIEPVDGERELAPGLDLLAAPGETPGHLALRLRAGGQSLYALGDLYHHAVELERSDWLVRWADPVATKRSRARLAGAVLAERAVVTATHIAGFGRLRDQAGGLRWEAL